MSEAAGWLDADADPIPAARLVHDWASAMTRAWAYLRALGEDDEAARALARRAVVSAARSEAWPPGATAIGVTLAAVRRLLVDPSGGDAGPEPTPEAWLEWRLRRWASAAGATGRLDRAALGPALARGAMGKPTEDGLQPGAGGDAWRAAARRRRWLLAGLVLAPTVVASIVMANALPARGESLLEIVIAVFFGMLFAWISLGFWTAIVGAVLQLRGDRFAITRADPDGDGPLPAGVRTAIVMPVCEEPVERVFAGLRAMWESVARAGALDGFDFFVLSDTRDPDAAIREELAWAAWCRATGAFGKAFYRRRRVRIARKSGNIADFCRRWGRRYRYMVVLDADSVMSGSTLVRLVRLMERRPDAAVIQTVPVAVGRRTTFARLQQFAGRLYGPLFAAGLHFWQLGDGQYWGHNAIIRVTAFMAECSLPRLPGRPPLGGRILSHDFVEAALLGRAGWTLWLAYDLGGSWEETPPTLLDEMQRDRRWCQGNLQHLRLLFRHRWRGAHRALFLNGAMSYASALLWLAFLAVSTVEAVRRVLTPPNYFPEAYSLFPTWPVWQPMRVVSVVIATAAILVLPKVVAVAMAILRGSARGFGGTARLMRSALAELVASSLLAPIRMAFHSRFVLATLLGRSIEWVTPPRDDRGTPWREALRRHGPHAVPAALWLVAVRVLDPFYFWWLLPVVGALIVAIPVSVLLSRSDLGDWLRRRGWLVIPEETAPPPEIARVQELSRSSDPFVLARGARDAVADPFANAVHRAFLRGARSLAAPIRAARHARLRRALAEGPQALDADDWRILLADPALVDAAHRAVWELPAEGARRWGIVLPADAPVGETSA